MESRNVLIFESQNLDLGRTGVIEEVHGVSVFAILYFDGTDGTITLRRTPNADDPHSIHLYAGMSDQLGEAGTWYVYNDTVQTGKTLRIKWGRAGTTPTAGVAGGGATGAKQDSAIAEIQQLQAILGNQPAIVSGQKTAPTAAAEALSAGQAVPDGFPVVVLADPDNAGSVYVGPSGVTTLTGYRLTAGASISYKVSNVSAIYVIGSIAAQLVHWTVEVT